MASQPPAGSRTSSGGHSSASNSSPPSPGSVARRDVWDLSIFKVPKPKSCIFWCNHCPPGLRRFLIWMWVFIGLAAAIIAPILIVHDLKQSRQRDLELECQNRANVLQTELRAAGDQALMYSGFVLTLQNNLTQANFQRFGETTLGGRFLLGRIAYLIRVTQAQRPLYDTPSFPFTEYAPNSNTIQVPRGNASEYALVRYTAQVPLRSNVFGLDLSADPAIGQTIATARDTGSEQISGPRTLYNGQRGFILVFGIYEPPDLPKDATVQQRRDACVGYTYAQVNVQTLADNVFANFTNKRIESRLYDIKEGPPSVDNLLYARQFQSGNASTNTLLDSSTQVSMLSISAWKPDSTIVLSERNRLYSVQCRRTNPNNAKIGLTALGYAVLIMFVVLMAALTMRISFKRLDSMEKEAARMHIVSERLSMAKAAAEAADTAKGRFLATVSHEIRTPLNGVLGCMSLLLDTPLNDVQLDYVRTARASGKALVALVNDVLDLSKVEAGAMELECEPFDVRSLIEDVLGMFASTTREKGLELAGLVREGVPDTLVGDAGRIRQVLINLLGNSVKFTHKGSIFVCVWAAYVPKPHPQTEDSERAGPSVSWVTKTELDATGGGGGATLRRPKVPFGSPSILVEPEDGLSKRVGSSFREDDERKIAKSTMFGSLRLGRSARYADPDKVASPGHPPGALKRPGVGLGNSSRFKHVTIAIPDPAGEESTAPDREDGRLLSEPGRSASFTRRLKTTLSDLARGAKFRKVGDREEAAKPPGNKDFVPPVAGGREEEGARQRKRRKSFEVYSRGSGPSISQRRDVELGFMKEVPEGGSRDRLLEKGKEGSSREGSGDLLLEKGKEGSARGEDQAGPKAPSIEVRRDELEQRIFFRVEDTGPGVAPNVQSKLFRPFQQADSSTSRKFGGTGIGLVISERLVTLMGGSMVAWSETDVGTSFQFDVHMPAVDITPPTPSSGAQSPSAVDKGYNSPKAPSELEGARVIVVQDEEVRREVAVSILQRMQMRVVGVCNCSEALELALAARNADADRRARGVSPEASPRGFGTLRRRLTRSGISSTPGEGGSQGGGGDVGRFMGTEAAQQSGPLDTSLPSEGGMLESSSRQPNEPIGGGTAGGVVAGGATPQESLSIPSHQRLESRGSVSSDSSGSSNSSTIAEQGRLPSLRLWNMAEEGDGEDKDVEKVIAAAEKALQAAEQREGDPSRGGLGAGVEANREGLAAGFEANPLVSSTPEIEQVSLSGSGAAPQSTTPTFSEVQDAPLEAREPFGRAPPDADVSADVARDEEASLALRDAAEAGRFRLVLVDLDCVGKVSALEFARQVKDDQRLSDLLVVGMTVGGPHNQNSEEGNEAVQAGLLGPVFKPLRRGALAAILHSAMHPEGGQLPRSPPAEESTPSTAGSTPIGKVRLEGKRILVVDDVAINVKVASRMIANLKCQVLTAASGQEAIDIFRREGGELDLILMDVQMPEMDGFEATQKIREIMQEMESQGGPKIKLPILALTADVMSGTKEECLKAGMDGYLPKPLNPKKLKELLYEFLGSDES